MNKAVNAARDETYKNRLRREQMPMMLVLLQRYPELKRKQFLTDEFSFIPKNPLDLLNDFESRCKEFDVTAYTEGDKGEHLKSVLEELRKALSDFEGM